MPRSKEISEDVRRKVVEAHESGKGYKLISKAIGLPKTTIRAILRKWKRFGTVVTLPRSGRPPKISPRARREIIREVMKNPCTTSKDLQATLASSNIRVHQSTIRRILGIHGRPTLSSIEGSMALSGREEDGAYDAPDGSGEGAKNPEERPASKNSEKAKLSDAAEEGGGRDENNGEVDGDGKTASRSAGPDGRGGADGNEKRGAETAAVDGGRRGDSGFAAGACGSTDNGAGNWSQEMDYISRLTFT